MHEEELTVTGPTTTTFLTREAHERLQAELADLQGPRREEIVARIEAAREEGDLKENGGYHAAKDEQGKVEGRIRQLVVLLRDAQVGEPDAAEAGVAGPGMVVRVRFAGDTETERFLVGSRETAGDSGLEAYSPQSPIGGAVTGHRAGETVSYTTPTGKTMEIDLLEVDPYAG
jgi:transcription elongation factor GreA